MKSELINVRPDARKESNGCNGTLEREEWRDVVGYEGLYQVSSFGRVRSLDRTVINKLGISHLYSPKVLQPSVTRLQYLRVSLCCNGKIKCYGIHRLVAQAFIPNPDNLPQVNHRNEKPDCNYPDNMEWCTAEYNCNYGGRNKRLSETKKRKFATDEEYWLKYAEQNRRIAKDPECRKKQKESVSKRFEDPEFREKWTEKNRKQAQTSEWREKQKEGIRRVTATSEWQEKHQKAMKELSNNDEFRTKMMIRNRLLAKDENFIKKHTQGIRKKFCKPIVQLTINGQFVREWECAMDVARELGYSNSMIGRCCKGREESHKGYIWKYKSDYENEQRQ